MLNKILGLAAVGAAISLASVSEAQMIAPRLGGPVFLAGSVTYFNNTIRSMAVAL